MQIDSATALSQFVGTIPTFIAVILAWELRAKMRSAWKKSRTPG